MARLLLILPAFFCFLVSALAFLLAVEMLGYVILGNLLRFYEAPGAVTLGLGAGLFVAWKSRRRR